MVPDVQVRRVARAGEWLTRDRIQRLLVTDARIPDGTGGERNSLGIQGEECLALGNGKECTRDRHRCFDGESLPRELHLLCCDALDLQCEARHGRGFDSPEGKGIGGSRDHGSGFEWRLKAHGDFFLAYIDDGKSCLAAADNQFTLYLYVT